MGTLRFATLVGHGLDLYIIATKLHKNDIATKV